MFWNEPSLYGATFPYRDIPTPMHNPLLGAAPPIWQNIPRFVPPVYGFNQPFFNVPPMHMNLPQLPVNPLIYSQMAHPFFRPFDVQNFYRPFF